MKGLSIVVAVVLLFGGNAKQVNPQQPMGSRPYFLHFPRTIDTTLLSITYFLGGPFGGAGGFVRTQANTWDYAIETSYEGKPATTLKAIVFCPGYETKLLEIAELGDSVRVADVDLEPLRSIRLSGKVIPPPSHDDTGLIIEATYLADWEHEFFGIVDGAVSSFSLASATVSQRGSFSMMVPDLAHDPTINSFKRHGAIQLIARKPKTGNIVYWLEGGTDSVLGTPVAEQYKGLILYARPNR